MCFIVAMASQVVKGSFPNLPIFKRGAWDLKKGLISLHKGTQCVGGAVGLTKRDVKAHRL